jgi:hypothetical protein
MTNTQVGSRSSSLTSTGRPQQATKLPSVQQSMSSATVSKTAEYHPILEGLLRKLRKKPQS